MFNALFYKEWIKTRRVVLLLGVILASLIIYTFINTGQMFRVGGAVQTWASIVLKDMAVLPAVMKWFPLLVGVMLGLVQFIPEMTDKRLKLTLHLPLPESRILSAMLLYGVMVLSGLYIVTYLSLLIGFQGYYPSEIIGLMTWQILPSLLGGVVSYLFAAWICLEPVWRQRVFNTLAAIGGLSLFCIEAKSGAYASFIYYLVAILIIGFIFPFYSASRFKDGAQS